MIDALRILVDHVRSRGISMTCDECAKVDEVLPLVVSIIEAAEQFTYAKQASHGRPPPIEEMTLGKRYTRLRETLER